MKFMQGSNQILIDKEICLYVYKFHKNRVVSRKDTKDTHIMLILNIMTLLIHVVNFLHFAKKEI